MKDIFYSHSASVNSPSSTVFPFASLNIAKAVHKILQECGYEVNEQEIIDGLTKEVHKKGEGQNPADFNNVEFDVGMVKLSLRVQTQWGKVGPYFTSETIPNDCPEMTKMVLRQGMRFLQSQDTR